MPFSRKTLPQLRQQIAVDIERYSGQAASSRGDIYYPLAQAVAGAVHGLHGHLQYTVEQLFDQSADDTNLLRRAAEMGIYRLPASRASGLLTLTGNNGVSIPAETLLQDDNQKIYRSTQTVNLTNGTANLPVEAVEAGVAGNLVAGTTLQFITPVSGVDTQASVISLSGGADAETISRVRERLAERRKHPPMGGSAQDYIAWTKGAHADITRAWCTPNALGLGTVVVRFVTDNLATPIPTQAHIDAVKAQLETVRPAGMKRLEVYAPVAKALHLTLTRLTPNDDQTRTAITAELKDLLQREAKPGGTIYLSQINEAISLATGERDHRISLSDDFTCAAGEFPILGDITWPTA